MGLSRASDGSPTQTRINYHWSEVGYSINLFTGSKSQHPSNERKFTADLPCPWIIITIGLIFVILQERIYYGSGTATMGHPLAHDSLATYPPSNHPQFPQRVCSLQGVQDDHSRLRVQTRVHGTSIGDPRGWQTAWGQALIDLMPFSKKLLLRLLVCDFLHLRSLSPQCSDSGNQHHLWLTRFIASSLTGNVWDFEQVVITVMPIW